MYIGNYKKKMVIIKKKILGSPALVAQQENVYNKKMLQTPSLRQMAARYYNFPKIEKKRQGVYIGNDKKKI